MQDAIAPAPAEDGAEYVSRADGDGDAADDYGREVLRRFGERVLDADGEEAEGAEGYAGEVDGEDYGGEGEVGQDAEGTKEDFC